MEHKRTNGFENQLSLERKKSIAADHSNSAKFNHGFVKFDLGNVHIPGVGSFHVKSEYPRLKPKFERERVENCDVEALSANLLVWINGYFETEGQQKYFKELTLSCVLFAVYTNPRTELYSEDMDLILRLTFWLWYNDDVIENAIKNKIDREAFKHGSDQLLSILTGKHDNNSMVKFEDIPNYPIFRNLFNSLLQLHTECKERLTEYEIHAKIFFNDLQRYFTVQRWFNVDPIDGRYSEETFKIYRKTISFLDGIANVIAMINNVNISDEISNSVIMKRLLEVTNVFGGYANDLLGMNKEFANGERDNLIVFMVLEKKIPIDVAVQRICDLMASELLDYNLLKKVIVKEFDYEVNLIKYLDILDSLIDGHNVIYLESIRHRTVGSVTLTR